MGCGCKGQKWTPPAQRQAAGAAKSQPASRTTGEGILGRTWNGPKAKTK